jgi:hypothetical protein
MRYLWILECTGVRLALLFTRSLSLLMSYYYLILLPIDEE